MSRGHFYESFIADLLISGVHRSVEASQILVWVQNYGWFWSDYLGWFSPCFMDVTMYTVLVLSLLMMGAPYAFFLLLKAQLKTQLLPRKSWYYRCRPYPHCSLQKTCDAECHTPTRAKQGVLYATVAMRTTDMLISAALDVDGSQLTPAVASLCGADPGMDRDVVHLVAGSSPSITSWRLWHG